MSAAEHLAEAIDVGCSRDDHDHVGDRRREVLAEVLGDDLNPSNLVLDAQAYRHLVERIEATMSDPDQWDGDDAEVEIIARYVEWLAAGSPTEDGWPVRPAEGKGTGTTGGEPTPAPDFFQPGRTYTDNNGYRAPEITTHFRVEHVTRHPESGRLRAIGWSKSLAPGSRWHGDFRDEGDFEGWTELSAPLLPAVTS
ncbi:hypothetical protein ACIGD1_11490 [Streptomyces sp. NPDC085612]|uniref:hypothetical protein n=1 Tax=Streptomyces sp. NPDC085612 TaxID=3365732 RepID=UPI0037D88CC6